MTTRAFVSAFRDALTRLASPPADQMRYLTALGTADLLDELALEFDGYFVPLAGELRRRAPRCESLCRRLDGMLDSDTLGWRFDDLGSDEWSEIRSVAVEAVVAFDEAYGGARMDRFDDAVSWGSATRTLSLFTFWPRSAGGAVPAIRFAPEPDSVRTYELEDLESFSPEFLCFEYDLRFSGLPDEVEDAVGAYLAQALGAGAVIAWFGYEDTVHFANILTRSGARDIYGVADASGAELRVDETRRSPAEWADVIESFAFRAFGARPGGGRYLKWGG
ncbi:hypothetical protein M3147_08455 [Agromyces mediolanus]|uniref:hypothetical protein n=1 Tax=Agromyces mediolanus TaxID=41986 RepID=UPI00203C7C86|nr:hypothetical protein [Agromyces mediolanus]MCM3657280.1 hypothetical protein [Agromyces mediolanus]